MAGARPAPALTYDQASQVIAKLADLPLVLVGGQAVSFWSRYYRDRVTTPAAAHTSKDIDFIGPRAVVEESARRLRGTAKVTTLDDANTPNTGVVVFTDDEGYQRQIDFLDAVAGVRETYYDPVEVEIVNERAAAIATMHVMDPISCLKARAYNIVHLPGYQGEHALDQLRAAILCAKEFVRDLLRVAPRQALKANCSRSRATTPGRRCSCATESTCSRPSSTIPGCRRSSTRSGGRACASKSAALEPMSDEGAEVGIPNIVRIL